MDFGKILDEWENRNIERPPTERKPKFEALGAEERRAKTKKEGSPSSEDESIDPRAEMLRWLAVHGVEDKDGVRSSSSSNDDVIGDKFEKIVEARRISAKKPDSVLDLHGKTALEASAALERFLRECAGAGMEKVLIIHGKGIH